MRKLLPAFVLLVACEPGTTGASSGSAAASSTTSATAKASVSAPAATATSSSSPSPAAATSSALASASATASPTVSVSGAPASQICLEDAEIDEKNHYCIVMPKKWLPHQYVETGPSGWVQDGDFPGGKLVLTRSPAKPNATVETLRTKAMEPRAAIVESGDLPNGFWIEWKPQGTTRRVTSSVLVEKIIITCASTAEEAQIEAARSVCKSLRGL